MAPTFVKKRLRKQSKNDDGRRGNTDVVPIGTASAGIAGMSILHILEETRRSGEDHICGDPYPNQNVVQKNAVTQSNGNALYLSKHKFSAECVRQNGDEMESSC